MNDEELSAQIRQHAERHVASSRLRAAVQTQIALHGAARQRLPSRLTQLLRAWQRPRGAYSGASPARAMPASLGFAAGVLLTLALVWLLPRPLPVTGANDASALATELIGLHVRAIGTGPLFQVASSDRHTVKPWFQGKLDYAPEVPDLADAGFVLLGGRIDRLRGHDTAALAYQLHKHIITAIVLPLDQVLPTEALQRRGFNFVHWSDGVMQVWALTDADAAELARFAAAWRAKLAPV